MPSYCYIDNTTVVRNIKGSNAYSHDVLRYQINNYKILNILQNNNW